MNQQRFFAQQLLQWAQQQDRKLPWKGEKNPYFIWLSEILLQQTRAEQGWPYYEKFVAAFPTIADLAKAEEDEVFKLWQGLGYYNRARNLHFTAKFIVEQHQGIFPDTYEQIRALKGVGDYTAAAIASFGFNLPYAVVDGNVYRVLSRFFGVETPIDSNAGKKEFAQIAQQTLSDNPPAVYNQAIMDFGALHCKPQNPLCAQCPMQTQCAAFASKKQQLLPIKSKKLQRKERYFYYFVYQWAGKILFKKRTDKDIWQGLYDFPMIEQERLLDSSEILQTADFQPYIGKKQPKISQPSSQQLTHQKIVAVFIEIDAEAAVSAENFTVIDKKDTNTLAFPKIISDYLANQTLSLF